MMQFGHWLWKPVLQRSYRLQRAQPNEGIFEVDQYCKDPETKKWGRTKRPNVVEGVPLQAGAEH
jgi:hypothetical protein